MLRLLPLLLSVSLGLSACARVAESRFNPFNWFGGSEEVSAAASPEQLRPLVPENRGVQVVDTRVLVARIESLSVDRTSTGAIIRASGIAATQEYFNAELVLVSVENGTATYELRAEMPSGFAGTGPAQSRRINVATLLSAQELVAIRRVVVRGAENALSSSR